MDQGNNEEAGMDTEVIVLGDVHGWLSQEEIGRIKAIMAEGRFIADGSMGDMLDSSLKTKGLGRPPSPR